eukprot:scaffold207809_cov32-Tisochrysis_lutea.AAC.7
MGVRGLASARRTGSVGLVQLEGAWGWGQGEPRLNEDQRHPTYGAAGFPKTSPQGDPPRPMILRRGASHGALGSPLEQHARCEIATWWP